MTGKSCFNCKHFEIRDNFFTSTGQKGFITDLKKCGGNIWFIRIQKKIGNFSVIFAAIHGS